MGVFVDAVVDATTESADANWTTLKSNVDPSNPNSIQNQLKNIDSPYSAENLKNTADEVAEGSAAVAASGAGLVSAATSYQGFDSNQWGSAINTTASIAANILKEKLIKTLTATKRVKIKSLLNSVGSCFTQTPEEFVQSTSEKLTEFSKQIPEMLKKLAAEYGNEIASDPAFQESLASLNEVQYISNVVNSVYEMYNSVMKVVMKFEPYFPVIEIVVSAASIFMTGGASAPKFSSESFQLAMQELKKAIPLIVQPLKEQVYNKEVDIPVALLGLMDFAASKESKSRFASALTEAEDFLNISDAQFDEVNRSLKNPIGKTLNKVRYDAGFNPKTSAVINNFLLGAGRYSAPARTLFFDVIDANKWAQVRRDEPASSGASKSFAVSALQFAEKDIIKISAKLADARDTTSKFYVDRQMFKLILEELKEDGCVIDTELQSYDETATLIGGVGDRKAFTLLNNRIRNYHALLRLLTGELRADIVEEIPVLDFYRKDNSSLTRRYTDSLEFNGIEDITSASKLTYAITEAAIDSDTPPTFNINLALAGYADAEYFFNSTARLTEERNLIVEYSNISTPTAPGILNGLFTKTPTRDTYGNILTWSWVDERSAMPGLSDGIALGTKFNQYYIWNRGTIIPDPLATLEIDPDTSLPYPGKATEWFKEAADFVETEIKARFTIPTATWQSLGYFLGAVTLQSYSAVSKVSNVSYITDSKRVKTGKKKWLIFNERTTVYSTSTFVRKESLSSFYPAKLENLTVIDGTKWTEKNQTIGSIPYLVIDATTMGSSVAVYTGSQAYASGLASTAAEAILSDPNAVFSAVTAVHPVHGAYIANINILSPFEMVKNKHRSFWDPAPTTILYAPGEKTALPQEMYLLSKRDLGFSLADNGRQALCSFYSADSLLAFEVTKIDYFNPNLTNFRVISSSGTVSYIAGSSPIAPKVSFRGGPCWIYTLSPIQVSDPALRPDFYALRYPREYFAARNGKFVRNTMEDLVGQAIAVSLPTLTTGQDYSHSSFIKRGVSFKVMQKLLDISLISNVVRGNLRDTVVISDAIPITLEKFDKLLTPWIAAESTLRALAATDAPELVPIVRKLSLFNQIVTILNAILIGEEPLTLDKCVLADSLLGNGASWFSIGDAPTDTISEEALSNLVHSVKNALNGTQADVSYPVRYLPGYSRPVGRLDSLYYQRYLFLNNRMNKSEGHLAKAEMFFFNWGFLLNSEIFKEAQINSYVDFIDAIQTEGFDKLLYAPPESEDDEGKFYIQEVIDGIGDQIHDKCLLVCAPCPVRDTCPFYDEASVLKKYIPATATLDMWFKDNELDLLVYEEDDEGNEYLNLRDANTGKRISAETMRSRHKAYTEIIHDEEREIDLDTIRDRLAEQVDGFEKNGNYVDGMDWAQGARYGSLELKTNAGVPSTNPNEHRYLYNALFIRDEDTDFIYEPTTAAYPVSISVVEGKERLTYEGSVRIKQPVNLKLFADALPNSDVYLISDDRIDAEGLPMSGVVYLNSFQNLKYDFDFNADSKPILSELDPAWPGAADIAQWCANIYKGMDPTQDQYWMPSVKKIVQAKKNSSERATVVLPGRPRAGDVIDTMISVAPSEQDLARGKPFIKAYTNFIRKLRIDLSSIRWDKSNDRATIETKKKQLSSMKTKLRLVVVKNP